MPIHDLPTRPIRNIPLLIKTLDHIKGTPEEWDQSDWRRLRITIGQEPQTRCTSTGCYAGHAVDIAGGRWLVNTLADQNKYAWAGYEFLAYDPEVDPEGTEYTSYYDGTKYVRVEERARTVLGLTEEEGGALFAGNNSIRDLEIMVGALVEGKDITKNDVWVDTSAGPVRDYPMLEAPDAG